MPNPKNRSVLLSRKQAAERLGVNELTVYRWESTLGLPVVRMGVIVKYEAQAIEDFIESHHNR